MKYCNDAKALMEYTNTMNGFYDNINDYNPNKHQKIELFLMRFPDMNSNKTFQSIVKELIIRCRRLNIFLVFITQSYFPVLKDIRLNLTY